MQDTSETSTAGHTLVVGGGIIGLSTAWEFVTRGHAVTLVDQGPIGKAASWAAAGILPPNNLATATDPLDRLRAFSHQRIATWADRLQKQTGIDVGYRHCGGWYIADTAGEAAAMTGMTQYWKDLAIECQAAPLARLAEDEPALAEWCRRNPNAKAWYTPGEDQIRPPAALKALRQACEQAGVSLRSETKVTRIESDSKTATVLTEDDRLLADRVVVCGGAWTGTLLSEANLESSVVPVRGQMLLLRMPQPVVRSIINVGQRYVLSRDDGRTLVGSCEEEVGFDDSTTDDMIKSLREFAVDLCPRLREAAVEKTWSGLRPLTFDGFPMIGKLPGEDRVYVAAGHFRSGIHLAFGTAELIADAVEQKPSLIDLDDFRVGKQQAYSIAN